jgi:hypothetical protein
MIYTMKKGRIFRPFFIDMGLVYANNAFTWL